MVEQILSTPETLNLALETWFIQDTLFGGAPFSLNLGGKMIGSPVVYLEFKNINLDFVRHVKSTGSKLVLFHMADELGDADISAYAQCDLVVRNYFFQTIMDSPEHADKLIWAPNGFRTGVGPRDRASLRKAGARTCLAAFAGWLANPQSHGGERARFAEAIPNGVALMIKSMNGNWRARAASSHGTASSLMRGPVTRVSRSPFSSSIRPIATRSQKNCGVSMRCAGFRVLSMMR